MKRTKILITMLIKYLIFTSIYIYVSCKYKTGFWLVPLIFMYGWELGSHAVQKAINIKRGQRKLNRATRRTLKKSDKGKSLTYRKDLDELFKDLGI